MITSTYPLVVELFIIAFSAVLFASLVIKKYHGFFSKYRLILLPLSLINVLLLAYLITVTSWYVTGDGYAMGARQLLLDRNYKDFFERFIEFILFYLSYSYLLYSVLITIYKTISSKLYFWLKILILTVIIIIVLFLQAFFPYNQVDNLFDIKFEFGIWLSVLFEYLTHINHLSGLFPLILVNFTFPENLIFGMLIYKLIRERKRSV